MEPPPPPSVTERVRQGWNRASRVYRPDTGDADAFGHPSAQYRDWLTPLLEDLRENDRVLDLGCGCGVPVAALLADRFRVTGVDISEVQIERARARVPRAEFVRDDMTRVAFPERAFRAVVCLYALIHVPLSEQRRLLARIRTWLAPGGWLVLIAGHEAYEGVEENWLGSGATMYWSHAGAAVYREWLREAGFEIRGQSFVPEGRGGHELFRARAR